MHKSQPAQPRKIPPNPELYARSDPVKDHYSLKEVVGHGHFGIVRRAVHRHNPEVVVAVKSIDKYKIKKDQKLLREIAILKTIDHPNIIKYYECFMDARYLHIVMEYCSGGELFEYILKSTIDEDHASKHMAKILAAVHHLHTIGICHRDLKPQNFIFESEAPDAELKLIDFGLSNRFGSKFKRMDSFVGTPYYIAPEVIKGSYDPACDVWSCGVIMYVMLTGQLPFAGNNESEVFHNILKGSIDLRKTRKARLSAYATDLLQRLLQVNPRHRLTAKQALKHKWIRERVNNETSIDPAILNSIAQYKQLSRMRGIALGIIVKYLSIAQIQELRAAFYNLDESNTGYLSISEIRHGLAAAGLDIPDPQLHQLFKHLDFQGNGQVNYSEFLAATISSKLEMNDQIAWWAFRLFDAGNTGFITQEDLQAALRKLGNELSAEEIREIISEVDGNVDGEFDGKISFEEFKKLMSAS